MTDLRYEGTRIMICTEGGQILGWFVDRKDRYDVVRAKTLNLSGVTLRVTRSKDGARTFLIPDTGISDDLWSMDFMVKFEGFQ